MTQYQIFVSRELIPWLLPIAGVALVYLGMFKSNLWKRALLALPSVVFVVVPVIVIFATPTATSSRLHIDVLSGAVFAFYFAAIALIVVNVLYVRTRLNYLQIANIAFAAISVFIMAMAVSGDWL